MDEQHSTTNGQYKHTLEEKTQDKETTKRKRNDLKSQNSAKKKRSLCGGKYNAGALIKENKKEVIGQRGSVCVTNEELQDNRKNSSNIQSTQKATLKENETTVGTIRINDPNELQKNLHNMEMKIWNIAIPNNNRKNLEKNNEGEDSDEWNDDESTEDEDNREDDSFEDGQDRIVHNEQSEEEMEYSQERKLKEEHLLETEGSSKMASWRMKYHLPQHCRAKKFLKINSIYDNDELVGGRGRHLLQLL
ncbi:hypothetical protein HAX54_048626 [Datura stramonium]|uniref:Uncharacterized protein n=1 Tax=Datura stramonium TaxID=4076 RepID=A0ABS8WN81_DATST|nr:hypothetical protein [Datura stramonium]